MSGDDEEEYEYGDYREGPREELTVHWQVNADDLPPEEDDEFDGGDGGEGDGEPAVEEERPAAESTFLDLDMPDAPDAPDGQGPGTDLVLVPREAESPAETGRKPRRLLRRPDRRAALPLGLVVLLAAGVGATELLPGG